VNERIKECWLKAAREDSSDKWDTQEEFIERFAKLIVRECALICESRPGPGDDIRSRQHCSEQILEHFGVER
jgi:hypothetical protein